MVAEDIIIRPIVTEKSSFAMNEGKYTFEVNKKATKIDIRNAVEKGKPKRQGVHQGRTSDWKKAIVTIATDAKEMTYLDKGGKVKKIDKKYKTSIEAFGA